MIASLIDDGFGEEREGLFVAGLTEQCNWLLNIDSIEPVGENGSWPNVDGLSRPGKRFLSRKCWTNDDDGSNDERFGWFVMIWAFCCDWLVDEEDCCWWLENCANAFQ